MFIITQIIIFSGMIKYNQIIIPEEIILEYYKILGFTI